MSRETVIICDRCGQMTYGDIQSVVKIEKWPNPLRKVETITKDLCPLCTNHLISWFKDRGLNDFPTV